MYIAPKEFISALKGFKHKLVEQKEIVICMGSEACDPDSFISSLVLSIHSKYIFVVNMSSHIFHSKGDMITMAKYFGIDTKELIFLERPMGDFTKEAKLIGTVARIGDNTYPIYQKKISLVLVDSHRTAPELGQYPIDLIIDHHSLGERSLLAKKIYLDTDVGSCATLISKYIGKTLKKSRNPENIHLNSLEYRQYLSALLMVPIIYDTSNFKRRVSVHDKEEWKKLKKISNTRKRDFNMLRKKMKKEKSLCDNTQEDDIILQKDLKVYYVNGMSFGIATVKYPFEDWIDRNGKGTNIEKNKYGLMFETMLNVFRKSNGWDAMFLNRKQGKKRYLAAINFSFEKQLAKKHKFVSKNYKGFSYYEIGVDLTRKIIAPEIKSLLERIDTDNKHI